MNGMDFIALCLAAGALINMWLHPTTPILSGIREWLIAWGEIVRPDDISEDAPWRPSLWQRIRYVIADGVVCRFCLSHHTPWILLLTCYVGSLYSYWPWYIIWMLPVYSLAITHAVQIIHKMEKTLEQPTDPIHNADA